MKSWQKAVLVALIHVAIVSTLGAKLLYDRATCPRVWLQTQNYDPNLPIRGRYVSLRPLFDDPKPPKSLPSNEFNRMAAFNYSMEQGTISVVNGKAVVTLNDSKNLQNAIQFTRTSNGPGTAYLTTYEPVLYFIPDTAANPSSLKRGEELWVEVTIPHKGPPRPIQLAIKSAGSWKPLNLN